MERPGANNGAKIAVIVAGCLSLSLFVIFLVFQFLGWFRGRENRDCKLLDLTFSAYLRIYGTFVHHRETEGVGHGDGLSRKKSQILRFTLKDAIRDCHKYRRLWDVRGVHEPGKAQFISSSVRQREDLTLLN